MKMRCYHLFIMIIITTLTHPLNFYMKINQCVHNKIRFLKKKVAKPESPDARKNAGATSTTPSRRRMNERMMQSNE